MWRCLRWVRNGNIHFLVFIYTEIYVHIFFYPILKLFRPRFAITSELIKLVKIYKYLYCFFTRKRIRAAFINAMNFSRAHILKLLYSLIQVYIERWETALMSRIYLYMYTCLWKLPFPLQTFRQLFSNESFKHCFTQ